MSLRRRSFSLALATPLTTARGRIDRREGFLVRFAAGGVAGVGEATPLPGWTEPLADCRAALDAVAAADDRLAPLVAGVDAPAPPADPLADAPASVADPLADAPAARHAVESALLDAVGRKRDRPLAGLLAADPAESVPVNATVGDGSVAETVTAARDAVDAGVACLKVKVGARDLERDLERLRAVRDAVGPDVAIRADANAAWDRETAADAVAAVAAADVDLAYLEQPLAAADLTGHAALRGRGVAVALDETLATTPPAAVLDADAADVLVLKPMALGGPARAAAVARAARSRGVDPVVTTTVDAAPARAAAVHVAAAVPEVRPCGLATRDYLADDLAPDPVPVEGGSIAVPTTPGIAGTAFDGSFDRGS
jgi:o-succinylbenzoate synthase